MPDGEPIFLGYCNFTDRTQRPVYLTPDGQQYVLDDYDRPVFGTWLYPEDDWEQPIILECHELE